MNGKRLSVICALLLTSLLIVMLAGCGQRESTAQPRRSAYCWQTTFSPNDSLVAAFIRHEHLTHIYLRYFDVVMTNGTPMPNASVNVAGRVPKGVTLIPVVYITNDCMMAIGQDHTEAKNLAEKILQRVRQMTTTLQLGPTDELQIDCDWTISTRRAYFDFLSALRDMAHEQHMQLSTTIRFHQLAQPVPPADRGVLMAYNTGDVRDIHNRFPILNIADVKPYLRFLATYKLPLSTAYPIFSWRVLFRGGHFVGILHSDDDYPILPGDKVLSRSADLRHILEAHQTISELRPDAHNEIILYDLQTNNIKRFQASDYEKIYHR
jgi:hypothetical protein